MDENSKIKAWMVFAAVPTFVAGVAWISFIAYTANSSAAQIAELKADSKEIDRDVGLQLRQINERLSRIETKLEHTRR